jgi:chromosome segregation ATPase
MNSEERKWIEEQIRKLELELAGANRELNDASRQFRNAKAKHKVLKNHVETLNGLLWYHRRELGLYEDVE